MEHAGNLAFTHWFTEGSISVQDESSMLVAEAVNPQPGMRVLDCCAAPGGKTTHLAEKMQDTGSIVACDVHEHKIALIREQANRLKLNSIETVSSDALDLAKHYEAESFDCILLDAPCSGLGVIRRKPDLKWAKQEQEIAAICIIQSSLLNAVQACLKPGGILVYSTCTMEYTENQGMVKQFIEQHPQFTLEAFPNEQLAEIQFRFSMQLACCKFFRITIIRMDFSLHGCVKNKLKLSVNEWSLFIYHFCDKLDRLSNNIK